MARTTKINKSRGLLDEKPILIQPTLAKALGVHKAIILQQIHYWVEINENLQQNLKDGYYWTYNSYPKWQEQFPFWSIRTIRRLITDLEKDNLLIVGCYNKSSLDQTKWYRINHEKLNSLISGLVSGIGRAKKATSIGPKRPHGKSSKRGINKYNLENKITDGVNRNQTEAVADLVACMRKNGL